MTDNRDDINGDRCLQKQKKEKTIQGFVKDGVIIIHLPMGLDPSEEKKHIDLIAKKLEKKNSVSQNKIDHGTECKNLYKYFQR